MKNQKGVSLITLIITIIVVIILAVIVLRSGASDTPDQAAFSGFTQEMGELQDAVKTAMLEAKADEILKGNSRTEAQLYNFIARGGYEVVDTDEFWLAQIDAEILPCTLIDKTRAEKTIGMKLPGRKVETAKGVGEEMSYFVTGEGIVFCWPPYVYDGKSYVNADTTVKKDTRYDKENKKLIIGSGEMNGVTATDQAINNGLRTVVFSTGEFLKISNNDVITIESSKIGYTFQCLTDDYIQNQNRLKPAVIYSKNFKNVSGIAGVAEGWLFDKAYYNNTNRQVEIN